jgi:hypothetical protein
VYLILCVKAVFNLKINMAKSKLVLVGNVNNVDGLFGILGREGSSLRPVNPTQTQHEISRLGLKGLTRLIKWIGLWLTNIILYQYFDTTQTRHTT